MFKVLSQQLRRISTTVFERYFTAENFTDMDHHHLNIFKQKSTKVPGKLSFTQESEPAPQITLLQDISLIIGCFFFAQINPVFKFDLVLIQEFSPKFICLFTFDILCILEFIQSVHFFYKNQ